MAPAPGDRKAPPDAGRGLSRGRRLRAVRGLPGLLDDLDLVQEPLGRLPPAADLAVQADARALRLEHQRPGLDLGADAAAARQQRHRRRLGLAAGAPRRLAQRLWPVAL